MFSLFLSLDTICHSLVMRSFLGLSNSLDNMWFWDIPIISNRPLPCKVVDGHTSVTEVVIASLWYKYKWVLFDKDEHDCLLACVRIMYASESDDQTLFTFVWILTQFRCAVPRCCQRDTFDLQDWLRDITGSCMQHAQFGLSWDTGSMIVYMYPANSHGYIHYNDSIFMLWVNCMDPRSLV